MNTHPNPNIVLIGGRATGKTTIAQLLAAKTTMPLYDMDHLISYEAHGLSIPDIVKQRGWHVFRDIEMLVALKLSNLQGVIIATGGGVICDQDEKNTQSYSDRKVQALKKNGMIIWLTCSLTTQLERMGTDPNRPSLSGNQTAREELESIMAQRSPWYKQAADHSIETDTLSEDAIVEQIRTLAGR